MDLSQNFSTPNKSIQKEYNFSLSFLLNPEVLGILIRNDKDIKDISTEKEECKLSQYACRWNFEIYLIAHRTHIIAFFMLKTAFH